MEENKAPYNCPHPDCGRKFNSPKDLELHIERRHKKASGGPSGKPSKTASQVNYEKLFLDDDLYENLEEVEQVAITHKDLTVFEPHKQIDPSILANITILSLSHNKLQDIEFLQFFPYLKELNLNSNLIENIWPVEDLKQLKKLWAANNKISVIGALEECKELKVVSLYNNQIFSGEYTFQVLAKLKRLKALNLTGNPCLKEPAFREKLIAYLSIKKLDEEKITERDRELAKELCRSLNIYDDTRAQTAPAIRVRTIKGFTDSRKTEQNEEALMEQQRTIKKLEEENLVMRNQLEKYKTLEKECKSLTKRCIELESENLMLKKRIDVVTNGKYENEHEAPKYVEKQVPLMDPEKVAEISDEEDFEGIEDEGINKAFKENREKMAALRKEIRLLIVQNTPGMTTIRGKKKRKEMKEGAYDYSEELK